MDFKRSLILETIETFVMEGNIGKNKKPVIKVVYINQDLVKCMKETRYWNELLIHPTDYTTNKSNSFFKKNLTIYI